MTGDTPLHKVLKCTEMAEPSNYTPEIKKVSKNYDYVIQFIVSLDSK